MYIWALTSLRLEKCPECQVLHIWGGNGPHYCWASEKGRTTAAAESSHDPGLSGLCVFGGQNSGSHSRAFFSVLYVLCFKFCSSLRNHTVPLPRLSAYSQGYWSSLLQGPLPSALTNSHLWLQSSVSSVRGDSHLCANCPPWTYSFSWNAEPFTQMAGRVMLIWESASWAHFVIPGYKRQQARHCRHWIPLSPGKHQRPVFSSLGVSHWLV